MFQLLLTALLPPLVAYLIGRGVGTSVFRGERIAGILGATALPVLFWLVVLAVQWFAPEIDESRFSYSLTVGGIGAILLTPLCLLAAWLGNRRAVRLRRKFGRSDRLD